MAYDWYIKRYESAHALKIELNKEVMEAEAEWLKAGNTLYSSGRQVFLKERGLDRQTVAKAIGARAGSDVVLMMLDIKNDAKRLKWLDDTLETDKRHKLIDLILRVKEVVGEITDARSLEVNEKGNLDGFVVGTKGKARVETIGAGGYNIVCFHYRTLVKPVR
jgi:hypothetical protein